MEMLIFGHGYAAGYVTRDLVAQGWAVTGTTRAGGARVAGAGAAPLIWPGDDAGVAAAIRRADAVLCSVAPGPDGDPVLAAWGAALAQARPRWIGYFSTTGVYGDHGGAWIDEDTPPAPSSARTRARVTAEAAWQALAAQCGAACHIFRLAGIYGPGRGPFAKLRAGTARRIIKENQVFSRIHADDIARAVVAALGHPGGVWNICDDEPAPPQDVIAHAAALLGMAPPAPEDYATAALSPMARSFYANSKRVSNRRMRRDLGVVLRHPGYDAGLRAILRDEAPQDVDNGAE